MFAIITAYLTVVEGIPAIPALMFADPRQMHGAGKYLRQEITSRFGWFHSTLCEQIEAGVQAGEFRGDVDPKVAAGLAAGIAQSLILRWRVSGGAIDMLAEAGKVYPMFLAASRACRLQGRHFGHSQQGRPWLERDGIKARRRGQARYTAFKSGSSRSYSFLTTS
jgi:hypothetical protein